MPTAGDQSPTEPNSSGSSSPYREIGSSELPFLARQLALQTNLETPTPARQPAREVPILQNDQTLDCQSSPPVRSSSSSTSSWETSIRHSELGSTADPQPIRPPIEDHDPIFLFIFIIRAAQLQAPPAVVVDLCLFLVPILRHRDVDGRSLAWRLWSHVPKLSKPSTSLK